MISSEDDSAMENWFICQNEEVSGPFLTEEVKVQLKNGLISKNSLIWGRLHPSWLPAKSWLRHLDHLVTQSLKSSSPPDQWHYALNGQSYGPFTQEALVQELSSTGPIESILLWTKDMKNWAPIFEFPEILDAIGVNKRQFPRAPLTGEAKIQSQPQQTGQLQSVSEGGLSLSGVFLPIGEVFSLEILSNDLQSSIQCKAQVRYRSETGITGLKFTLLPQEGKNILIQYLKQAIPEDTTTITQAA